MEREVGVARPMVKFTGEGVSITDQSCLVRSEKVNDKTAARRLRKNWASEVRQSPQPRPGIRGGCSKQHCTNPTGGGGFCNVAGLSRILSYG